MDPLALLRRLTMPILGAMILLGLIAITFQQCTKARQAGSEAALAQSQSAAVGDSGRDAVASVGRSQRNSEAIDQIHMENAHAIAEAPGADAPVDPGLSAAARRGLCRYAANRGKPECVQLAPATGVASGR